MDIDGLKEISVICVMHVTPNQGILKAANSKIKNSQ